MRATRGLTGKPYTGEWYDAQGLAAEAREEPLTPYPSDTECLCLVELEDGTKEPDYACNECKGTGKRRFFSLYEQTLMSEGRIHMYEGGDYMGVDTIHYSLDGN